ncbi:hypothetical protein NCCP1664_26010 [Zafaria cholistanensis]|uniref:Uncharacterized protein n=1 Tax=Zafaria cholistanensis TaxID=1682741 RepID=A0A5A7NU10_9MICC|nr:hypothetical protein NCCP1664_26010 [Zafaria cholistanensis]
MVAFRGRRDGGQGKRCVGPLPPFSPHIRLRTSPEVSGAGTHSAGGGGVPGAGFWDAVPEVMRRM